MDIIIQYTDLLTYHPRMHKIQILIVWVNQFENISYPKSYFSAQKIKKNLISGVRGKRNLNIIYQIELKFLI